MRNVTRDVKKARRLVCIKPKELSELKTNARRKVRRATKQELAATVDHDDYSAGAKVRGKKKTLTGFDVA